jgi:hypothetical protein
MANTSFGPTSHAHIIVGAILAGLQVLNGAAALGDVIGPTAFGLLAVITAAFQAGWQFYTSSVSVPTNDVAAAVNSEGSIVAGPAAVPPTNAKVDVVPASGLGDAQAGM